MSTNYYLRTDEQENQNADGLHLGLSSGGIFMLRAHPKLKIVSIVSLERHLRAAPGKIISDYKETLSVEEFLAFVEERRKPERAQFANSPVITDLRQIRDGLRFKDEQGYLFCNYEFS